MRTQNYGSAGDPDASDAIMRLLLRQQEGVLEVGRLIRTVHLVLTLWCDKQFRALEAITQGRYLSASELSNLWQVIKDRMHSPPVVPPSNLLLESISISIETLPPTPQWRVYVRLWKSSDVHPPVEESGEGIGLLLKDSIGELYEVSIIHPKEFFRRSAEATERTLAPFPQQEEQSVAEAPLPWRDIKNQHAGNYGVDRPLLVVIVTDEVSASVWASCLNAVPARVVLLPKQVPILPFVQKADLCEAFVCARLVVMESSPALPLIGRAQIVDVSNSGEWGFLRYLVMPPNFWVESSEIERLKRPQTKQKVGAAIYHLPVDVDPSDWQLDVNQKEFSEEQVYRMFREIFSAIRSFNGQSENAIRRVGWHGADESFLSRIPEVNARAVQRAYDEIFR